MRWLPLFLLLGACGKPTESVWMEGFGYGWQRFNHRVSYLSFHLDGDGAEVGIIGGTSTTGLDPELPQGCDASTCDEFPFYDFSPVEVHWARATASGVVTGLGVGEVMATSAGASATVTVALDGKAKGEIAAVIQGFTLDTNHPLSGGDACYLPQNGWHPRHIAIALGEPSLSEDGRTASVEVTAWFEAGNSLEDERACIDEVREQAVVPMQVDVQVIAGKALSAEPVVVSHSQSYTYGNGPVSPDEQPDPDFSTRTLDLSDPDVVGWRAWDFRFHVDDPDDRGAYLRTLSLRADPEGDLASGHATNYSPGTQLSGFDYAFEGTAVGLSFDAEVTRGTASGTLEELVDAQGAPTPITLPL